MALVRNLVDFAIRTAPSRPSNLWQCCDPACDVTVYSLPIDVDFALGNLAVMKALEMLAGWKTQPIVPDGSSRSIVVYLDGGTQLRILDERLKYAPRKFGAGEGLSSSRR